MTKDEIRKFICQNLPVGMILHEYQIQILEVLYERFMANYRQAYKRNHNNYRKLHALPLKRRPKCRWRQRESKKNLAGLSTDMVIIDECAFAEEVSS